MLGGKRGLRPTFVAALFLILALLVAAGLTWALSGAPGGTGSTPAAARLPEKPAPASQEIIDTSTPPAEAGTDTEAEPESGASPDAVAPLETVPPLAPTPPLHTQRPRARPLVPDGNGDLWPDPARNEAAPGSEPEPEP